MADEDLYGPTYEGDERSPEDRRRAIDEQVALKRGEDDQDNAAVQLESDAVAADAVIAAEDAAAEEDDPPVEEDPPAEE